MEYLMLDSQSDMNRNLLNFFVHCMLSFTRDREKVGINFYTR